MGSLTQKHDQCTNTNTKLPVIEFSKENMKAGGSGWMSTANCVRHTLEDYGCFLAVLLHGDVDGEATSSSSSSLSSTAQEMHNTMFQQLQELFDLPLETKVKNTSDILGFGYGGNFSTLLVEYFGMENGATLESTQSFTNLMWPAGNDFFCEIAYSYSKLLSDLYQVVMQMVFEDYGVDKSWNSFIQSASFLLRYMKYYRTPQMKDINTGLPSHTDKDFLTVLETNQVQGLEIETREGEWIEYKPSPSTYLVIAGEAFTAWSNGRIYAPLHRVVIRGDEVRYSIGLFSFMCETVQTPEELIDEEHPLQFKPFDHFGFLKYCGEEGKDSKCPIKSYCGA